MASFIGTLDDFYSMIGREIAACKRHGRTFSMAYIYLENIKEYGKENGHSINQHMMDCLSFLRATDICAKVNQDPLSFSVILPETTMYGAGKVIDRIRDEMLKKTVTIGRLTITLPVMYRIIEYYDGETQESLIERLLAGA